MAFYGRADPTFSLIHESSDIFMLHEMCSCSVTDRRPFGGAAFFNMAAVRAVTACSSVSSFFSVEIDVQ